MRIIRALCDGHVVLGVPAACGVAVDRLMGARVPVVGRGHVSLLINLDTVGQVHSNPFRDIWHLLDIPTAGAPRIVFPSDIVSGLDVRSPDPVSVDADILVSPWINAIRACVCREVPLAVVKAGHLPAIVAGLRALPAGRLRADGLATVIDRGYDTGSAQLITGVQGIGGGFITGSAPCNREAVGHVPRGRRPDVLPVDVDDGGVVPGDMDLTVTRALVKPIVVLMIASGDAAPDLRQAVVLVRSIN